MLLEESSFTRPVITLCEWKIFSEFNKEALVTKLFKKKKSCNECLDNLARNDLLSCPLCRKSFNRQNYKIRDFDKDELDFEMKIRDEMKKRLYQEKIS